MLGNKSSSTVAVVEEVEVVVKVVVIVVVVIEVLSDRISTSMKRRKDMMNKKSGYCGYCMILVGAKRAR